MPEEFADAYRQAFERALGEGQHPAGAHAAGVEAVHDERVATGELNPVPPGPTGGSHAARPPTPDPGAGSTAGPTAGTAPSGRPATSPSYGHGRTTEYRAATPGERLRESPWFLPALVALLALVLIAGAYGVGRLFSAQVDAGSPEGGTAAPSPSGQSSQGARSGDGKDTGKRSAKPWHGKVSPVSIGGISVSCVLPPGVDAAGHKVTYPPSNMLDGKAATAWRCGGRAIDQKLVVDLPENTRVGMVGLVAGYAKTDPANGVDRYRENNRITKVRWTIANGVSVVQRLDGSPEHRALQTLRVPPTRTGRITVEILDVVRGPRNTTAISTLVVRAAG